MTDHATRPAHEDLVEWAAHALTTDIPLEQLADALPYSGATVDDAAALIDNLTDTGWTIVPTPGQER